MLVAKDNKSLSNGKGLVAVNNRNAEVSFTEHEREFLSGIINDLGFEKAAYEAGFTLSAAARFIQRRDVQTELANLRDAKIVCDLTPKAIKTASDIMDDEEASAATRGKVAVSVLDISRKMTEAREAKDDGLRTLDQMSPAELLDMAAQLRADLEAEASTIEGEASPPLPGEDDLF